MLDFIRAWFKRYLSDQGAIVLLLILISCFLIIIFLGHILAPALAALVLGFLLQGLVNCLERRGMPHQASVGVVFTIFMALLTTVFVVLTPIVWSQLSTLIDELPVMISSGRTFLRELPEHYPEFIAERHVNFIVNTINAHLADLGQKLLSMSLTKLPGVVALVIYLILVPILVFFFLKDKDILLSWVGSKLPEERRLFIQVIHEMNGQIANYIRGKAIEILIIGSVSYVCFAFLGLNYALLLGALVGFSVLIPYIGATVVTIPVALIGIFQWGISQEFLVMMITYTIIQVIDGNILVPLLFSGAVKLHPVAIILAVLIFGGLFGFWGVFFAIPLATLCKAVMNVWPTTHDEMG